MDYNAGTETYYDSQTQTTIHTGLGFLQYYVNGLLVSAGNVRDAEH